MPGVTSGVSGVTSGGPLIGIAGASYVVARPWGQLPVHGIPRPYVDQVVRAGGRPVVLPPRGQDVLDALDGLVLGWRRRPGSQPVRRSAGRGPRRGPFAGRERDSPRTTGKGPPP